MKSDFDGVDFTQLLQIAQDLLESLSDIQSRLDDMEARLVCLEDQVFGVYRYDPKY